MGEVQKPRSFLGSLMPWPSGKAFATKHNKKLTETAATTAAKVGNALLTKGYSEGKAIRIANSIGDKQLGKTASASPRHFYGKRKPKGF